MALADYILSQNEKVATSLGAINSFGEYLKSKINKIANFLSGTAGNAAIYFEQVGNEMINKVAMVSSDIYDDALDNPNTYYELPITDNPVDSTDYIEVRGSDITDAVEQMVADLRAQEQFVDYCLHSEETDANTFITRLRGLAPNIPGIIIEKFSNIIQISGSPIECLKNYFGSIVYGRYTYADEKIALVDPSAYIGNAWLAALDVLIGEATSFFAGIWKGVDKLGEFFAGLVKAIGNLTKWLFGKLFSQFMTVYDKACSAPVGIMDFPLIQFTFNGESELREVFQYLISGNVTAYGWTVNNRCMKWGGHNSSNKAEMMTTSLIANSYETVDGVKYATITEVVIPSYPFNISMRFGVTDDWNPSAPSNSTYCLALYIITDFASISKYSDLEVQNAYFTSFRNCLQCISSIAPLFTDYYDGPSDISSHLSYYTNMFFDATYPATREFPLNVKAVGVNFNDFLDAQPAAMEIRYRGFVGGLLAYLLVMSHSNIRTVGDYMADNHYDDFVSEYWFYPANSAYTMSNPVGTQFPQDGSFDITKFNATTFKPYNKENLLPVTVHYQTIDDQAREVLDALKTLVVAVVTVVVTVKVLKWSKARKQKTLLAHAAVDSLSWQVAENPSAANISAFKSAYNKARRIDVINGFLGVGDGSSSLGIISTLGSITTSLGKVQGKLSDENSVSFNNVDEFCGRILTSIRGR